MINYHETMYLIMMMYPIFIIHFNPLINLLIVYLIQNYNYIMYIINPNYHCICICIYFNPKSIQSASCTLDAGVKIYAGRVDSVHADAYKMLGSLGRATVGEEGNYMKVNGAE